MHRAQKAGGHQMHRAQKAGAYLAVGDSIVNTHRDELLADDLGQLGCLHQALHLAGRVGKHRLDLVGLQVSHPLLHSQHANFSSSTAAAAANTG